MILIYGIYASLIIYHVAFWTLVLSMLVETVAKRLRRGGS
jgi:hypothetical protein